MHPALATNLVILRPEQEGDRNFIYATWLNGLRYGNPQFGFAEKTSFFKNYHEIIDAILYSKGVIVMIACLKDEPDVILGYSVYETPNILHWVFVKPVWRKVGIARKLVPETTELVTHITTIGKAIIEEKAKHLQFDPFLI